MGNHVTVSIKIKIHSTFFIAVNIHKQKHHPNINLQI